MFGLGFINIPRFIIPNVEPSKIACCVVFPATSCPGRENCGEKMNTPNYAWGVSRMLLFIFQLCRSPISFISRKISHKNEGSLFSIVLGPTASVGGESQHPLNWNCGGIYFSFFSFLCIFNRFPQSYYAQSWCRAFVADTDSLTAFVKK